MKPKTALYRHYNAAGKLLYVGVSLSAAHRLVRHSVDSSWFYDITRIDIEWLDTRQAAFDAERHAIKNESPEFNKQHNCISASDRRFYEFENAVRELQDRGDSDPVVAFRNFDEVREFAKGYDKFCKKRGR